MKRHVAAVLDRPTKASFGMLGVVVAATDGKMRIEGVSDDEAEALSNDHIAAALASGTATPIEGPELDSREATYAALWVGDSFAEMAHKFGVPVPSLLQPRSLRREAGVLWFAPRRHAWRLIDSWLRSAFRKVVATHNQELAELMMQTLPRRLESRAARWVTAATPEQRHKKLAWWSRLDRDSGRMDGPERLREDIEGLLKSIESSHPLPVVGFSALAKGGDKEIARFVAARSGLPLLSFGAWLVNRAHQEGRKPTRETLQHLGQRMIDESGALGFSLYVLDALASPNADRPFIIEGIRHRHVLESIRSLVGDGHLFLTYVSRPEHVRKTLLRDEEGFSAETLQQVLNDPTEVEIPSLRDDATFQLDREAGVEQAGTALLNSIGMATTLNTPPDSSDSVP